MSKIYQGAVELIGNTPLVEVTNLEKKQGLKVSRSVSQRQCWKMQSRKAS